MCVCVCASACVCIEISHQIPECMYQNQTTTTRSNTAQPPATPCTYPWCVYKRRTSATQCTTAQPTATQLQHSISQCNLLQHSFVWRHPTTATQCIADTLKITAPPCNSLHYTATPHTQGACNSIKKGRGLRCTTNCYPLQQTATHCTYPECVQPHRKWLELCCATKCITLQHTATLCTYPGCVQQHQKWQALRCSHWWCARNYCVPDGCLLDLRGKPVYGAKEPTYCEKRHY